MALELRDSGQLRRLQQDLERHATRRMMQLQLRRELADAAEPLAEVLRLAYRSAPSSRRRPPQGRPGLREALADAVTVQAVGAGALVTVRVDGRLMPEGMRTLPAYWEGVRAPWRHPWFGNREVWVQQPARPTFYPTVASQLGRVERALGEAADRIIDRVT